MNLHRIPLPREVARPTCHHLAVAAGTELVTVGHQAVVHRVVVRTDPETKAPTMMAPGTAATSRVRPIHSLQMICQHLPTTLDLATET